jgi:hypothetical protein
MARPRKEINKAEFEKLCAYQSTQREICAWFDVTDKTLNAWCRRTYRLSFSEVFKIKRQIGYASLRRAQFELAKKNATMAIFLGKNLLGQQDVQQQEVSGGIEFVWGGDGGNGDDGDDESGGEHTDDRHKIE